MSNELPQSELLDARQAAALIGVGRTTVFKLDAAKKMPAAIRLTDRLVRWRRQDLLRWIELGAPTRERFEEITQRGQAPCPK